MIKPLKYLSYLGVDSEISLEMRKNIILSNQFAFTWILIVIPYIAIFAFYDTSIILLLSIIVISHTLTLVLNSFKLYVPARLLECIVPEGIVFVIGMLWYTHPDQDRYTSYYVLNIAFMVSPFLIFTMKEYGYIIICVAFSLLAGYALQYANTLFHLDTSSVILTTRWFELFNYSIAAGFLVLGFTYLKKSNEAYEKKICALLGETTIKNKQLEHQKVSILEQKDEIEAQRDEIIQQKDRLEYKKIKLEEQHDMIYNQNKEITDSINYARNIQLAMLPPDNELQMVTKNYFVFNRPYAAVSGDFYWVEKREDLRFLAVGDCTGHGVPGGFLSMLGMAYLTEIVMKHNTLEPHEILNELKDMFMKSLRQTNKEDIHFDGIDLALCVIDVKKGRLSFAGAFNSLYIIRNKRLMELKGDKMPIGFYLADYDSFGKQEVDLKKGDCFYMFTDGYLSQPGGKEGRKLNKRRFKQLLLDIHNKPCKDQKKMLQDHLDDWLHDHDQMDDILVMGFSID